MRHASRRPLAAEAPAADVARERDRVALALRAVAVRYGRRTVLRGVDLALARGEVYALLGRNGSGKSSLVRTLLGQQPPAAGSVRVLGADPWRERATVMRRIGVVPEEPQAPPEMTATDLLGFVARVRGGGDVATAAERLRRLDVPRDRAFGKLSKGQKKQVELALALLHAPALVVLDDPTLGLDPLARKTFFGELMAELADAGTTVLLTTHDLAAVESIADRVGVLGHPEGASEPARLLVDEPLEHLKGRFRRLLVERGEAAAGGAVARAERPWGTEVVVADWDEARGDSASAQPLSLEEIFAVLHEPTAAQPSRGKERR